MKKYRVGFVEDIYKIESRNWWWPFWESHEEYFTSLVDAYKRVDELNGQ